MANFSLVLFTAWQVLKFKLDCMIMSVCQALFYLPICCYYLQRDFVFMKIKVKHSPIK